MPPKKLEIGNAETLLEGSDIAIVAIGSMVQPALEAARNLEKLSITPTVVNARFIKPIDENCIERLAKTHSLIVTVEEAYLAGGFGSAVLEVIETRELQSETKVIRMGVPDRIVTHGDPKLLLAKYGLDADGIYLKIKEQLPLISSKRSKSTGLKAVK
jgi:1-deoxy-D-xylulose-5-phosphate synthase